MIPYATYCQIQLLHEQGLSARQIARQLHLGRRTVRRWLQQKQFVPRASVRRASLLDPWHSEIVRLLALHPYSAQQLFQQLRPKGYEGSYSTLKRFVRQVRPKPRPAFLTLRFAPGECAQVDWGFAGFLPVGSTRRRLSFFVLVLCYSRLMYVEFTLGEKLEHWLAAHQNAFAFLGGVPAAIMIDNPKVAVLHHPVGGPVTFNPHYLDFAHHYGFQIKPCTPRQAHEKGRVENGVGYVKKNLLAGLDLASLPALTTTARHWLDTVANVRLHGETHCPPVQLFAEEKTKLKPLHPNPYPAARLLTVRASSRFRVDVETNHYSVPARYASQALGLRLYPDRLLLYHQDQLVAEHVRSYDRHQDLEHPDHAQPLLTQRRQAREQQLLARFLALGPRAAEYYQQLENRQLNARHHARHILALSELYGVEPVQRALEDALHFQAFSAQYIANLLQQRQRQLPEPGALHLTRPSDLLELELPAPDLSVYEPKPPTPPHENP
jgi:transposase